MKVITIKSWNIDIAYTTELEGKLILDLQNKKYACYSPLNFQSIIQVKEDIGRGADIYKIGLIADSISGAYGKSYFDKYFANEHGEMPSILDRLSFIGNHGLGALDYEPSDESSTIQDHIIFSLKDFKKQSIEVYNAKVSNSLAKLIAKSNSGAGGAKAKAVIEYNPTDKKLHLSPINSDVLDGYVKSIVKFNNSKNSDEITKHNDELKLEYIYYLLAKELDINMSRSWLEKDEDSNYYFITQRFDIDSEGNRLHLHSLAGVLSHDASSFTLGYESLFRVGIMLGVSKADKRQMFKTMLFNLVFANRDDHSRNFSFLMDKDCSWSYAPSYDLTYSATNHGLKWHQLTIDKKPSHSLKSLGLKKIAKLCEVDDGLEMISSMIYLKHSRLRELAKEHNVESMVEMIFNDTLGIDKIFRSKK